MFLWIPMFLSILINHSSIQAKPEVVILQGNGGQLTSPGYPSNYPNNVKYTWIIKTDDKRANVTFYIQEMDIEKTPGFPCDDYLEITEEDPCCFRLFKRCYKLLQVRNLTVATRPSKPPSTDTDQPSKPPSTDTDQPSKPPSTDTDQPSKQPSTDTDQLSKTRTTGQQSTTLYRSRTDTSNRTTSTILISFSSSAISVVALLICLVVYKRKRRNSSISAICIHTYGCTSEGPKPRGYTTTQTRLVHAKDFREYIF